jgi:hypothetical protein
MHKNLFKTVKVQQYLKHVYMQTIHNNKNVVNPLCIDKTHSWNKMLDDIKTFIKQIKNLSHYSTAS